MFERILLLNKKKYAAVKLDEGGERTTEVKGLDMKRREFSKISKDASSAVLKEILSGESTEVAVEKIHELLTTLGETVKSGAVPLEDFIIFKVGCRYEVSADPSDSERILQTIPTRNPSRMFRLHSV